MVVVSFDYRHHSMADRLGACLMQFSTGIFEETQYHHQQANTLNHIRNSFPAAWVQLIQDTAGMSKPIRHIYCMHARER